MKVQAAAESFVAAEANEHAEAKAAAVQTVSEQKDGDKDGFTSRGQVSLPRETAPHLASILSISTPDNPSMMLKQHYSDTHSKQIL